MRHLLQNYFAIAAIVTNQRFPEVVIMWSRRCDDSMDTVFQPNDTGSGGESIDAKRSTSGELRHMERESFNGLVDVVVLSVDHKDGAGHSHPVRDVNLDPAVT